MKDECFWEKVRDIDLEDEKHWERSYAILLEASNKKIAELEKKLNERDSVRLWNENEELKAKLKITIEALTEASEYNNYDDVNGFAGSVAKEALEKIK